MKSKTILLPLLCLPLLYIVHVKASGEAEAETPTSVTDRSLVVRATLRSVLQGLDTRGGVNKRAGSPGSPVTMLRKKVTGLEREKAYLGALSSTSGDIRAAIEEEILQNAGSIAECKNAASLLLKQRLKTALLGKTHEELVAMEEAIKSGKYYLDWDLLSQYDQVDALDALVCSKKAVKKVTPFELAMCGEEVVEL